MTEPPDSAALFAQAIACHRAGDLATAGARCLQIMTAAPRHADALHLLGIICCQRGQAEGALGLLRQATLLVPDERRYHLSLGHALLQAGRPDEAAPSLARAVDGKAGVDHAAAVPAVIATPPAAASVAHASLADEAPFEAVIAMVTEATMSTAHRAVALNPKSEADLLDWARSFGRVGNVAAAADVYRALLTAQPDNPLAAHMLAAALGDSELPRASDGYVSGLFDDFAGAFDKNLADLKYRAPQLASTLLASIVRPASDLDVLDLGCGTGLCGPLLRPYARRLTGIDLSPGMLGKARERAVYDELVTAEITGYLGGCATSFDLVVSTDVLIYFGRLDAPFAGIARVLRPGGRVIVTLERLAPDDPAGDVKLHPHGRYSHAERHVRAALEAAGLVVVAMERAVQRMELGEPVDGIVAGAAKP